LFQGLRQKVFALLGKQSEEDVCRFRDTLFKQEIMCLREENAGANAINFSTATGNLRVHCRVARWYFCEQKNPNLGKLWRALKW
jgi:hypothetical protein